MRIIVVSIVLMVHVLLYGQKQSPTDYIELYKDLAIAEMYRSGVPASITLAQGILESNSGNSRLAKYANNHFGIKCKGNWEGNVIYAHDDAPDECFRAYPSVEASFQDHSDFLRNNWRYHPLFELHRTDYEGWCKGLRKAGYATNAQYHTILINLIERYELHTYDHHVPQTKISGGNLLAEGEMINNVPVTIVKEGQSISSLAQDVHVKDRHIRKWNDLPRDAEISPGEVVYLKPKRRRGPAEQHIVTEGETMHSISQVYGIKLKQLYKKNRMEPGQEPQPGENLYMQSKRDKEDEVEIAAPLPDWGEEEPLFVNPHQQELNKGTDTVKKAPPIQVEKIEVPEYHTVAKGDNIYRIAERYQIFEEDILLWNKDLNPVAMHIGYKVYLSREAAIKYGSLTTQTENLVSKDPKTDEELEHIQEEIVVNGPVFHHVVKGDTLYNICKRYEVTEDQLKAWNGLDSITIYIGQKLQVSE